MAISLRVVILLLVAIVAIATTIIALVPVRNAGLSAVRETAGYLRIEISTRLRSQLLSLFDFPMSAVANFGTMIKLDMVRYPDLWTFVPPICDTTDRFGLFTYAGFENGMSIWGSTERVTMVYGAVNGTFIRYWLNPLDWKVNGTVHSVDVSTYDPRTRPWYPPVNTTATPRWSNVYINSGGGDTALTASMPILDKITGIRQGAMAMDIYTTDMIDFLRGVQVARTGRVLMLETATNAVLGGNWNESAVIQTNVTLNTWRLATLNDYQDPLLRRTRDTLGAATIFGAATPFATEFGKGKDRVYVDIVTINDNFNLNLRLLVMIPESDFLAEVNKNVNVSIGAVVGAVVGLMILAFLFTMLLLAPLNRLEERMYAAGSFDDNGEEEPKSILSEVANIQEAYGKMQAELKRVKSYLPRSILARLEDEDALMGQDGEEEGDIEHDPSNPKIDDVRKYSDVRSQHSARSQSNRSTRSSRVGRATTVGAHSTASSEGKAVRGLYLEVGLTTKKLTMMFVNLSGFNNTTKEAWRKATTLQAAYLTAVETIAKKHRGVIDSFHGDHVVITFNAVVPCTSHQQKAGHAALQICKAMHEGAPKPFLGLTIGVATGDAHVGNNGIEGLKRFCVIGPVYNHAQVLERMCKQFKVETLVNQVAFGAMHYELNLQALDVAKLPFNGKASVLYTICGEKSAGNDEWMYAMEKEQLGDLNAPVNEAFLHYAKGDTPSARGILDRLPAESPVPGVARLRDIVNSFPDVADYVLRQGLFYTTAFHYSNEVCV